MIGLTFYYFLQLKQPLTGLFSVENKINLIIAHIIFFLFLTYALVLYLILYRFCSKNHAGVILNNEAQNKVHSYFCQSFSRIFRNCIRGFFHSFFLSNYSIQILGLAGTGLISVFALVKFRKSYKNSIIYVFLLLYHLFFFCFDLTLSIHHLFPDLFR